MVLDDNRERLCSTSKDPKLFHSVQADPIKLLQLLRHKPLWEVLTPMQLHCELSVNTWLNYLRRACPTIAEKFLKKIGLPLCPDRYDYNGNQCAIVVKEWQALQKLLPTMREVKRKHKNEIEMIQLFECVLCIPECLEAMDLIMKHTMSRRLNRNWKRGFEKLSTAFHKFEPLYRNLVPTSEENPRILMTPKIRVLLVYVKRWVNKFQQTLIAISEGPFETFHDDYRTLEQHFKIPRPPSGGSESDSEEEETQEPDTPACGTRSERQKKRKAEAEADAAREAKKRKDVLSLLHFDNDEQQNTDKRRSMTIQKRRLYSIAAHTTKQLFHFPRLVEAAELCSKHSPGSKALPWNEGFHRPENVSTFKMTLRSKA